MELDSVSVSSWLVCSLPQDATSRKLLCPPPVKVRAIMGREITVQRRLMSPDSWEHTHIKSLPMSRMIEAFGNASEVGNPALALISSGLTWMGPSGNAQRHRNGKLRAPSGESWLLFHFTLSGVRQHFGPKGNAANRATPTVRCPPK